jgi:hypothetical protein
LKHAKDKIDQTTYEGNTETASPSSAGCFRGRQHYLDTLLIPHCATLADQQRSLEGKWLSAFWAVIELVARHIGKAHGRLQKSGFAFLDAEVFAHGYLAAPVTT